MAEYGYAYRSFSTYSTGTVRNETREPVIIKPSVPSLLPKSNGNKSSEGHVTRKTIVPVTSSRPYDDSATEKYPSRGGDDDDNQWHRQTSPVRGSPRKVDHEFEANRPQRFSPVANSTGWRHTPHEPTPYSSTGAEGRKPIATNNGTNGYGYGYGGPYYGGNKEGRKPVGSTIRNDNHGGYNINGTIGYGNDYGGNKERAKPVASNIRNGDYGTNGYGGDYGGNKEGRKQPIGRSTIRKNDNHDGTNNIGYVGDKGGRNKKDNYDHHHEYDGTNNGYGGYSDDDDDDDDHYYNNNNKDGYNKPTSLPIRKNDGHNNNNGYGIGNGNNKEQRRPFGSTTRNNNNYDDDDDDDRDHHHEYVNYNRHNPSGTIISSDWTKAPRKGTQLSEPTHDIEKALELLKMEAAKREHNNSNKGSPHSRSSMPMEPASPNKGGNYGSETDDHDRKGPLRTFANLSSRPRTPIIDSRKAVEMFNGTRV